VREISPLRLGDVEMPTNLVTDDLEPIEVLAFRLGMGTPKHPDALLDLIDAGRVHRNLPRAKVHRSMRFESLNLGVGGSA